MPNEIKCVSQETIDCPGCEVCQGVLPVRKAEQEVSPLDDMVRTPDKSGDVALNGSWYVKLPGATALVLREIAGQTKETVLLRDNGSPSRHREMRYKTKDIEFVEAF